MTADDRAEAPLDIALLAPLVAPIRQPYLGGAQALLRDLAVSLATHGHTVTLYAARGSDPAALPGVTLTEIEVDAAHVRPSDFSAPHDAPPAPVNPAVEETFARAFDLIAARAPRHMLLHAHAYDVPAFQQARRLSMPVAHTLHMPALDATIDAVLGELAPAHQQRAPRQPWLTTVSHACAATYQDICRIDAVVYNGIDLTAILFGATAAPDGHALFAGRITPEKGVEDAIEIALAAQVRLLLVGDIYDRDYYGARIAPLLAAHPERLTYLGPRSREDVWKLMSEASAVLVPSHWDEPFGLVACEAQATGTPIVGYAAGGLREVVAEGQTGALVARGRIAEAATALREVAQYDRRACRERVATHFSLEATVAGYEALYRRMLAAS